MSAANLHIQGNQHSHPYESPSHSYATRKIAELERLLPPGPLSIQDRSKRIHHLLLQCCRTIVRRSDRLRLMFNNIISSTEAKQENNKYTAILRQWEKDFYDQIEVEGSIGWNYLHEANFDVIVEQLERCCNDRYQIISTSFGQPPHISSSYTVSSIWKGIRYERSRADRFLPAASNHKRLELPFEARRKLVIQTMAKIDETSLRFAKRQTGFIKSWTVNVYKRLKSYSQLNAALFLSLEIWVRIEDGLEWVREDPKRASQVNNTSRSDQWQTLSEDEIEEVVSEMIRDPGIPQLDEVHTPAPPYTARALAQRRRISRRQARLRQDLRTFGAADDGGLLI